MDLISDGLLFLTALTTGFYCLVLARRLRRFGQADDGIGPRIQALSAAVDEMRGALGQTQARLEEMRRETALSSERMTRETARAKRIADDLNAAAAEAERTLDALYRSDRRIAAGTGVDTSVASGALAASALATGEGAVEFESIDAEMPADRGRQEAGAVGAAGHDSAAASDDPAAPGVLAWSGGDVLRVERMTL